MARVESRCWSLPSHERPRLPVGFQTLLTVLAPAMFFEGYDALILGLALPLIR